MASASTRLGLSRGDNQIPNSRRLRMTQMSGLHATQKSVSICKIVIAPQPQPSLRRRSVTRASSGSVQNCATGVLDSLASPLKNPAAFWIVKRRCDEARPQTRQLRFPGADFQGSDQKLRHGHRQRCVTWVNLLRNGCPEIHTCPIMDKDNFRTVWQTLSENVRFRTHLNPNVSLACGVCAVFV